MNNAARKYNTSMKYFFALVLNLIFVWAFEVPLLGVFVFISSTILLVFIYYHARKCNTRYGAMLELMCFTMPFAWRSIFGTCFSELNISWFYIICLIYCLIALFEFSLSKFTKLRDYKSTLLLCVFLLLAGIFPVLYSYNLTVGVSRFLPYVVFFTVVIASLPFARTMTKRETYTVMHAVVMVSLFCAIMVIAQFSLAFLFDIDFLIVDLAGSPSGLRRLFSFMFLDASANFLLLATGAIICFVCKKNVSKRYLIIMVLILTGVMFTSTRTAIVSFAATVLLFIFRPASKYKVFKLFSLLAFVPIGSIIVSLVRPGYNIITFFTSDSGRTELVFETFPIIMENLFLGTGFDWTGTGMDVVIHVFILNVLLSTGIIYTLLFLLLVLKIFKVAMKKHLMVWLLVPSVIGSFFIPELIASRFFVIIVAIIILAKDRQTHKKMIEEPENYLYDLMEQSI